MTEQKVTLLDCIKRIPERIEAVLQEEGQQFEGFLSYYGAVRDKVEEIILVGSGTSNTVSVTARPFVERTSGLPVRVAYPNDLAAEGSVYPRKALYVFVSQTGTSSVVVEMMEKLSQSGFWCVSLTESPGTRLAGVSPCHICLNCGEEEYGMRTIGYTVSVLNLMLLGLHIGVLRDGISREQFDAYLADAAKVPESHRRITADAERWFEQNKRGMMRSDCIVFTGADEFYGLALEAAVKFWEMPQVISMGYELEEGLHGPNYGYSYPHCVIVFNDGGRQSAKALSLARYMKDVFHNGYVIGAETVDEKDLVIAPASRYFQVLEYSAAPQVAAYFLTIDGGRDLMVRTDHSVMNSYFTTHSR